MPDEEVPVIDLTPLREGDYAACAQAVAEACAEWGFFQVVNHGVDPALCVARDEQMRAFFALPIEEKRAIRRSADNARGFFDDELTKQRRDWKQCLDFGNPASRDWARADDDAANANLDGFNRFPPASRLPDFRATMSRYFDALTALSNDISKVMAVGLGMPADYFTDRLHAAHSSFLRLNYYPVCDEVAAPPEPAPLGISPHKDAGFLTVLAQDPDCHSLQVRKRGTDDTWATVHPLPDAFTVNTGDMAQIWSNNRYHAPEHRVLTSSSRVRYSAPFFLNPAFDSVVSPLPSLGTPEYLPCVWGYFRAQRFAGDFADYGTEIQISDFAVGPDGEPTSWHVDNQARFMQKADFGAPFSVEANRPLLARPADAGATGANGHANGHDGHARSAVPA